MTKTMKQLYNIYTLRWNDPSTDYQGSATCPQSVSYTFIQTKTKKQLYNIYTLRWNDPQITRGRQRVHNQLAIYTFIQSLPNSVNLSNLCRPLHIILLCDPLTRHTSEGTRTSLAGPVHTISKALVGFPVCGGSPSFWPCTTFAVPRAEPVGAGGTSLSVADR